MAKQKIAPGFHCLIMEDVRLEVGNKRTLVGVYGDSIYFAPGAFSGEDPPGMRKLVIVAFIPKTHWAMDWSFLLSDPENRELAAGQIRIQAKPEAGDIRFEIGVEPFVAHCEGTYTFKLENADSEFDYSFKVGAQTAK